MRGINSNSSIIQFIAKALVFFMLWYLVYELWLLPDGRLDEWLSLNIIATSSGILNELGFDVSSHNRVVFINQNLGIEIVNGCNGIAAIGLYIGFIIAFPGSVLNKLSFIVLGIGVIYLTNISRIMFLTIIQDKWPMFFEITHDYSTTAIFYLVIFLLWMLWVNFEGHNVGKEATT